MKSTRQFTALIEREDHGYVALCPELDIASEGESIAEAKANLQLALELFFASAAPDEIKNRLQNEFYITRLGIAIG